MKVGIIVYSHTGNTLSVAQNLEQTLKSAGHDVTLDRVESASGDARPSGSDVLKTVPDISPYDVVVFASPVHAFSLAPLMKQYLSQVSDLSGKTVCCFVTQHLKKAWMGGNHAIRQIKSACKQKGAAVHLTGVINWSGDQRDQQIQEVVKKIGSI